MKILLIIPIFILTSSTCLIIASTNETNKSTNSSIELSSTYSSRSLAGVKIGCYTFSGTNPRTKYSTFVSHLTSRGATIEDISVRVDNYVLAQYSILWFDMGGSGLTTDERNSIDSWIDNGGSLIITGNFFNSPDNSLQIMNLFSVSIVYDYDSGSTSDIINHPITTDVSQIYFINSGRYLVLPGTASPCVRLAGLTRIAVLEYNFGKMVMIMDNLPSDTASADNLLLLDNIFGWLSLNTRSHYNSGGGAAAIDNNDVENNSYIGILVVVIIIGIISVVSLKKLKKWGFNKARDTKPQELSDKESIKKFTEYIDKMTSMNKALEEKFTRGEVPKEEYTQKKSVIVQKIKAAKEKLNQLKKN